MQGHQPQLLGLDRELLENPVLPCGLPDPDIVVGFCCPLTSPLVFLEQEEGREDPGCCGVPGKLGLLVGLP